MTDSEIKEWEAKHRRPCPDRLSTVKYLSREDGTSSYVIVCDEGKVLCQGIRRYPWMMFFPITWNRKRAEEWIASGNIGELQEELTNLAVGFEDKHVKDLS